MKRSKTLFIVLMLVTSVFMQSAVAAKPQVLYLITNEENEVRQSTSQILVEDFLPIGIDLRVISIPFDMLVRLISYLCDPDIDHSPGGEPQPVICTDGSMAYLGFDIVLIGFRGGTRQPFFNFSMTGDFLNLMDYSSTSFDKIAEKILSYEYDLESNTLETLPT